VLSEAGHASVGLRAERTSAQELALQGREKALGHGVFIGIADRPHRGSNARFLASTAEGERYIKGGFKRSSQQPDAGGCDEHSKAAIG